MKAYVYKKTAPGLWVVLTIEETVSVMITGEEPNQDDRSICLIELADGIKIEASSAPGSRQLLISQA